MPFDDLAAVKDGLAELPRTFFIPDLLKRRAAARWIVDERQWLGLLDGSTHLPETIFRMEVSMGCEKLNDLRAVDVVLQSVYGLEVVHLRWKEVSANKQRSWEALWRCELLSRRGRWRPPAKAV